MSFMKNDQHIDPDLVDRVPRAGACREYAQRFIKPEQINDVDQYLGKAAA